MSWNGSWLACNPGLSIDGYLFWFQKWNHYRYSVSSSTESYNYFGLRAHLICNLPRFETVPNCNLVDDLNLWNSVDGDSCCYGQMLLKCNRYSQLLLFCSQRCSIWYPRGFFTRTWWINSTVRHCFFFSLLALVESQYYFHLFCASCSGIKT